MNRRMDITFLDQSRAYEQVIDFWKSKGDTVICNWFNAIYYSCLVNEYFLLRRDIPEQRGQYEYLVEKIKENRPIAARLAPSELWLPLLGYDLFDAAKHDKIVLYGYGVRGAEMLRWLQYFNLRPVEIWDVKAEGNDFVEGIPFRKMHGGLPKDVLILLSVDDRRIRWKIEDELFGLGYERVLERDVIDQAFRRRLYREMLPFLMEVNQ